MNVLRIAGQLFMRAFLGGTRLLRIMFRGLTPLAVAILAVSLCGPGLRRGGGRG